MNDIRAYDIFGNIAIVKFSEDTKQSAKKKFAEKLLKSNKAIRTVLEKSGKFKGRLRKQATSWVAGEKTKEALYKENDCVFRFNIDKVYFSPRLSNERKEVASLIRKKDKVLVMFAGVGPYSIVIAKKTGAMVWSNEINREANKYGRLNTELNKVKVLFLDGDIKRAVKKIVSSSLPPSLNLHSLKGRVISINNNVKQSKNYVNNDINFRSTSERAFARDKMFKLITNAGASRGKLSNIPRYFDAIVMPRPQLKDSFLREAFFLSKKGTRIFYYDFCKNDEINLIKKKIELEAKKSGRKIKILKVKKAGEIAPYRCRVRVDFKVL